MKSKVIYSDKILNRVSIFMTPAGIAIFPFVILREKYRDGGEWWVERGNIILNHENIHFQQALELGVIPFYILYVLEFILKIPFYGRKAYYNISFEREAYDNAYNLQYLYSRRKYTWISRILS